MFTRNGGWSFIRVFDAIYKRLIPRERIVYLDLQQRATRYKRRPGLWRGKPVLLEVDDVITSYRELSQATGIPTTSVYRAVRALEFTGFLKLRERDRANEGGGLWIHVNQPDEIPKFRASRAVRLEQLRREISSQKNWDKDEKLRTRWNTVEQGLKQLKQAVTNGLQMDFTDIHTSSGTMNGILEVFKNENFFLTRGVRSNSGALSATRSVDIIYPGSPESPETHQDGAQGASEPKVGPTAQIFAKTSLQALESLSDPSRMSAALATIQLRRAYFHQLFPDPKLARAELERIIKVVNGIGRFDPDGWKRKKPEGFQGGLSKEMRLSSPIDMEDQSNRDRAIVFWWEEYVYGKLGHERGGQAHVF